MLYVYLRHAVTVTSRGMRQVLARYQIDMHDDTQVRVHVRLRIPPQGGGSQMSMCMCCMCVSVCMCMGACMGCLLGHVVAREEWCDPRFSSRGLCTTVTTKATCKSLSARADAAIGRATPEVGAGGLASVTPSLPYGRTIGGVSRQARACDVRCCGQDRQRTLRLGPVAAPVQQPRLLVRTGQELQ